MTVATTNEGNWPEPDSGQVEVLLLGTVHMTWSELDDVLGSERQRELRVLDDHLEAWQVQLR